MHTKLACFCFSWSRYVQHYRRSCILLSFGVHMQQANKQLQLPYIFIFNMHSYIYCKACNLVLQVAALSTPTRDVLYIPHLVLGVGVG